MKIKIDFITNSSSASIMLFVESVADDLEEFKKKFNEYMEHYKGRYEEHIVHFWDPNSIEQLTPHLFTVNHHTSMFNYVTDIPHYMQVLTLESLLDPMNLLENYGFKGIKVKVKMDY